MPHLAFASPRKLPRASSLSGRVVVLDLAFAATAGGGVSFTTVTLPFLRDLGDRLAAWVDHHDHERHGDYRHDERFVLATKAEHGACPEMITPDMVARTGPIDSILVHSDVDGLYSAAKWILGGHEPYSGADDDARCIDTRRGQASALAMRIDHALRARFRDNGLKRAIVAYLVDGMRPGVHADTIAEAADEFAARSRGTAALAARFTMRGQVAYVDARRSASPYDKTDLLLAGQARAPVSAVHDSGMVTIAAGFDSGWNFVTLLGLEGGMPTRVTIPEARLTEALAAINGRADTKVKTDDTSGDPGLRP